MEIITVNFGEIISTDYKNELRTRSCLDGVGLVVIYKHIKICGHFCISKPGENTRIDILNAVYEILKTYFPLSNDILEIGYTWNGNTESIGNKEICTCIANYFVDFNPLCLSEMDAISSCKNKIVYNNLKTWEFTNNPPKNKNAVIGNRMDLLN